MKTMLMAILSFGAMGTAAANDYYFGQLPIPPHGYNSQPLPASYSDTATFYVGNWVEPDGSEYQYANSVNIVFQGEWTYGACSGRGCVPPVLHTTMPTAHRRQSSEPRVQPGPRQARTGRSVARYSRLA